jgi:hypothetical protein
MNIKKASLVFLALIMVIICFNAPAEVKTDEHPWDQEGGAGTGTLGDTANITGGVLNSFAEIGDTGGSGYSGKDLLVLALGYVYYMHDVSTGVSLIVKSIKQSEHDRAIYNKAEN